MALSVVLAATQDAWGTPRSQAVGFDIGARER